jgi:site-specific recombinase
MAARVTAVALQAPPAPAIPSADELGALIAPSKPQHAAIRQLHAALVALEPTGSQEQRVSALEQLGRWLRSRRAAPLSDGAVPGERAELVRLRLLGRAVQIAPGVARQLSELLHATISASRGGGLFASLGIPTDGGLTSETVDRLSRRFLPEPRDDRDLLQIVTRLFPGARELAVVAAIPPELLAELAAAIGHASAESPWAPLGRMRREALAVVAMRISAVGLSDALRARSPELPLDDSPYFLLQRAVDAVRAAIRTGDQAELERSSAECRRLSAACRSISERVVENLESSGVSVDVVYRLELISKGLDRLERLLDSFEPASPLESALRAKTLLVELLDARLRDHRLSEIFRDNLHLLARKIIERAGHTGEHYITSTRSQHLKMLLSSAGGGVLTAGTTAFKFAIGSLKAPPFVEGVLSSVNYAGSFVAMQLCGFTLATKQPSVTAAALAGTLRETAGHPDLGPLVTLIARITRSQLAAALGNLGLVIPACLLLDFLWRRQHGGEPLLNPDTARYAVDSLHPLRTGTIFYAALTGVLLWSSSLAAGWLENWAVYRRLPEAIEHHPLRRFVGRRVMAAISRAFARNVSGFGGNISLGVLLAMTPIAGKFFGLPFDVRHVTLSTGALTLGVSSLGSSAGWSSILAAACGIVIIGCLNFGVSFVLALAIALRARQVERSDRWRLLASLVATFVRSPGQFFFPPRDPEASPVHGPVSLPPPPPPH